jgi:protein phosphatase 1G
VALYVKDRLVGELRKLNSFKQKDWAKVLTEGFIKIDELLKSPQGLKDILKYQTQTESTSSIFGRPETDNIALYTGCTACACIITDTEIICANAGDSRCVLSEGGRAIEMSIDHKPDLSTEKARIEKAGGFVEDNRVKGVLNLSRSLGDLEYKQDNNLSVDL